MPARDAKYFVQLGRFRTGRPFFHAGDDLLRSKIWTANSFDSGLGSTSWIQLLNPLTGGPACTIASQNHKQLAIMQPLLANPALMPRLNIAAARDAFREGLRIRGSSQAFCHMPRLQVPTNLQFLNGGPSPRPADR